MTLDELRLHLQRLIDGYVWDQAERARLLSLVRRTDVPVKALLVGLEPFVSGTISQSDANIIKDIAFHFC